MNRLYHVPLSPFCRKVRLSLAEKRIEVDLVEERYWERDLDFMRRNPAGKVPAMTTARGTLLGESSVLLEYLEDAYPDQPLYPADPEARARVRQLMKVSELYFDLPARRLLPRRSD